jgi:multidrug resistance protein
MYEDRILSAPSESGRINERFYGKASFCFFSHLIEMKPILSTSQVNVNQLRSKPYLKQILLLGLAQAILMFAYGAVLPILPYYLIEFGAGSFEYGLLVATFSVFAFISAGPFGSLSDRIGRKRVILISLIGSSISLTIFGLANSIITLFLARAAEGFFTAGLWPAGDALVSDIVPSEKRGSAWGMLLAGRTSGMIFGPTMGGLLAFFTGVRFPFLFNASLAVVALLLCLVFIQEPLRSFRQTDTMEQVLGPAAPSILDKLKDSIRAYQSVLTIGGLLLAVALILRFTRIFSIATIEPMFSIYTSDPRTFAFSPLELGVFFFFFASSNAVSQLFFGRLSDSIGHTVPMALSGIVTAVGLLLSLLATTPYDLYMVAVILGVGGAMALPSTAAVAAEAAPPRERGRVMGLLGMAGSAARATGPILGGFFYAYILSITDIPYQAALLPLSCAITAGIIGTIVVIPLMLKKSTSTSASSLEKNGKLFEED